MKIAFIFDSIQADELNGGSISPSSRTVKLFKYLTTITKNMSEGAVTKLFIAGPKPGKCTAKELREHAQTIQTHLIAYNPDLVVCMGKSAIYAISDWLPSDFPKTVKFQRLWGKYFAGSIKGAGSVPSGPTLLFTPSPSMVWAGKQQEGGYLYLRTIHENLAGFILQSSDQFDTISNYISRREELDAITSTWLDPKKRLLVLSKKATVGFDTETTGLNVMADKIRTVQFSVEDGKSVVVDFSVMPPEEWTDLLSKMKKFGYRFVLQNGKYDYKILKSNGVQLPPYEELSIAHVLVDEREGTHNLDFIGQQVLGAGKTSITKDALVNGPIDDTFIEYAGRDTDITRRAFNIIFPAVGHTKAYETLTTAAQHLAAGEHYGMKLDTTLLAELNLQADTKLKEYRSIFKDVGLNPNSPKQVKEYFGLTSNADKNILEGMENELAHAIVDYRGLIKVQNTYLQRLQASANIDGRFHPDIRLAGPVTGRTSSGSGAAPADMLWLPINSQNIPRPAQGQKFKYLSEELRSQLRNLFIADEGKVMLGMDLAAAEMRMAANACMDATMIDDLNRKVDTHSLLTIMAYNLPYEIDLQNPDVWVAKVKKDHEFQRQSTKNATFAVLYGGGLSAIAAQAKCDTPTASLLRDTIYDRYKGLEVWIEGIHNQVKNQGFVTTRYGRKRIFPYSTGVFDNQMKQSMLREAQNYVIQSEASDYCLMGLNKFMANIPPWIGDVYVQNMVHDALYFSVDEDDADKAKDLLIEMVQTADDLPATLYADAKYATTWGDL